MDNQEKNNDSVYIVKAVRDFLNTWNKKPCNISLERFDKEPFSMMLQQLAGSIIERKYVDGSYIGKFPFAVYVRTESKCTKDTITATGILMDLASWLTETDEEENFINLPVIDEKTQATEFEMASAPSIVAQYEDGAEDYQAVFTLKYYKKRRN